MRNDIPPGYVLLVEDDAVFAGELCEYLAAHGIRTVHVSSTNEAMERLSSEKPLGIVLDQFVGTTDTLAQLSRFRASYRGGIMFLSGNDDVTDRVVGLEMGASDFVSKTTQPREILARIRLLTRRPEESQSLLTNSTPNIRHPRPGHWHLDVAQMELYRPDGGVAHLTGAEFETLRYLESNLGRVVSRDELVKAVLHRKYNPLDRSIDNVISRLRKKLDNFDQAGRLIKAIRNEGYVFVGFGKEADVDSD
jgi:two-component system, OmpR family, response regulator